MIKSIFQFKLRWIISFLFVIFSFILILGYYKPGETPPPPAASSMKQVVKKTVVSSPKTRNSPEKEERITKSLLHVDRAVVCIDISDDGRPLLAKEKFHKGVDFLVCYSALSEIDAPKILTHRWVHGRNIVAEKKAWLQAGEDAVWTKCDMPPHAEGKWRVDIVSAGGKVLDYVVFRVD